MLGDALNRLGEEITRRIARLWDDEAQLRAMLAGMVEGVVAVDGEDRVVFSNEAARTLLGLSIVKHMVQAMNGEVSVESELGTGSCFRVRLPLASPATRSPDYQ